MPPSSASPARLALGPEQARALRLCALGLAPALGSSARPASALAVTQRLGALQAQEYGSAVWSLGVRSGLTQREVESAVESRQIVRTWPMRGTIHWVPARDARWMCQLTALRHVGRLRRVHAELGITEDVLARAGAVLAEALQEPRSRPEVFAILHAAGVETHGQRGYHLLGYHCMTGLVCQGPRQGQQPSFVLLERWVRSSFEPSMDDAAATLVERYVRGHGPVREPDIAGWLGHTLGFVRAALERLEERVIPVQVGTEPMLVHADTLAETASEAAGELGPAAAAVLLLPQWDEYLLGYKDRSLFLPPQHVAAVIPGRNMAFQPTLVIDGVVRGTWRRRESNATVTVEVTPFRPLNARQRRGVESSAQAVAHFLGGSLRLLVHDPGAQR